MPLIKIIKISSIVFLIFLAFYICFYKLGTSPLDNWDEAWYADMSKNMLKTKEFILPMWNKGVYFDKPPLYMWSAVLFASIFGVGEFSARITSAISGFLIIVILTICVFRKYGFIPMLVAYSTITFNNLFIWRTRSGNVDLLTAILIFISYFLILSKIKNRLILLGLTFSLLYLTRASYVLFPLIIFAFHEFIFRKQELLKNKLEYFKFLAIFLLLPSLWLFMGFIKAGHNFIDFYVFNSDRGTSSISLKYFNWDYMQYAYYSLQRRFFYIFIIGLFWGFLKIKKPEYFLQVLFSIILIVFLSFVHNRNNWYLIPSIPFWSLLCAYGTYKIIGFFRNSKIVMLGILIIGGYISYKTFTVNIMPILNTTSSIGEKQSGLYLKSHAKDNAIAVRLDHLYPTVVYYSERKILSSPSNDTQTRDYFISRSDLIALIKKGEIKWLSGVKESVITFLNENKNLKYRIININQDERIVEII